MSSLLETAAMIALGIAEGYAMCWAGVSSPQFFRDQFQLRSFGLVKFFFGCVGSSMVAQGVMSLTNPKQFEKSRFYTYLQVPYSRTIPGCLVLGLGMYIAASGPTMMGNQLWMGVSATPFVIAGALLGGALFGMVEPALPFPAMKSVTRASETSVDGKLGVSYAAVALPMGMSMLFAAHLLEQYFPHADDIARIGVPYFNLSPLVGSLLVGLNQVPIRFITSDGQGGSTCIMNAVATATFGLISPRHKMTKLSDAHQLLYVYLGMGLGTFLLLSQIPDYRPPADYGAAAGLFGGMLAAFGARYAAGCTCGHGVSGVSELSLSSWAGAASIFGAAMLAGLVHSSM